MVKQKKRPLNESTKINKKIPFKKDEKIEFEFKSNDVGKVSLVPISILFIKILFLDFKNYS